MPNGKLAKKILGWPQGLKILDEFSKNIDDFKKAITEKNGDKLLKIFASTKNVRKEIIKAGQDVELPDFGRKKN